MATINSDEVGGNLNVFERLVYRHIVFPRVQSAFLDLGKRLAFVARQEPWGPGRVDTFNPYKAIQFNFPMEQENIDGAALNGSSDYPSIWRQRPREGMNLHWDGNNDSVAERNLSAALGAGVTPVSVDRRSIAGSKNGCGICRRPTFPGARQDRQGQGGGGRRPVRALLRRLPRQAAGRRATTTIRAVIPRLGKVEPLAEIGTDPGRWASYTQNFAAAQNLLYAGYPWRFHRFHKTEGYANHPLDGIWARSPYLHNGSVPTLRDLLEPSARRPGGLVSRQRRARPRQGRLSLRRRGTRADRSSATTPRAPATPRPGTKAGATAPICPASAKDAIVEYMKTL